MFSLMTWCRKTFCLPLWMNRVHLTVHCQQTQPHCLCSSLSEFHVAASTQHQAQVNIFSHWQGFPIQAWHDVNHRALTTLEGGQIELMSVHSMSYKSLEPLEFWGHCLFEHSFHTLAYFLNARCSAVSSPPSFQQHQHKANFDIKPGATCQKV